MTEHEFIYQLKQHAGKLHRIAWAILGQESDAWDALQEATEAALEARKELRGGPEAFPAWMRRILTNKCLNMLRARRRVVPVAPEELPEPAQLPSLEHHTDGIALWEAVRHLPREQRQVVTLRYLCDLSTEEMSAALDVPAGTVKSRLHRALQRLRASIDEGGITHER